MRARCESPKSVSYKNYGARGIRVCDRWKVFENYEADIATLGPAPGPGYSIDRIDNNGDYCLSNVRWASRSVQSVNQRARRDNTSGAVGVYKHAGKWRARITLNTRIYNLGCFTHIEDAKAAYEKAKAARGY
jgi:DNA-dependent RNA polymerase auxiliary subunit epsilon